MEDLEGKVICNKFMDCDEDNCNHRIPHIRVMFCHMPCGHGGECVHIRDCWIDGALAYGIKRQDGNYHRVDAVPAFRDHLGENQHIDDMLQQDANEYSDLIDELSKPKPEIPKPVHERVKRFLNLEL